MISGIQGRLLNFVLNASIGGLLLISAVAGAAVSNGATYAIKLRHAGFCVDVSFQSRDQGASAMAWRCKGASDSSRQNQRFQFKSMGGGNYQIVAGHSGMCLAVPNYDGGSGAALMQVNCSQSSEKDFRIQPGHTTGSSALVSAKTGKCVSALVMGTQEGTVLLLSKCDLSVDQDFDMIEAH